MRGCAPPLRRRTLRGWLVTAGVLVLGAPAGATAQEAPPEPGERVRLALSVRVTQSLGIVSPIEGTLVMLRDDNLVTSTSEYGSVALPLDGIHGLEVQRPRGTSYAVLRGTIAGTAFGLGMYGFLRTLCGLSSCGSGTGNAWIAAGGTGLLVGALVASQGPGTHWVDVPVPGPSRPGPTARYR